MSPRTLRVLLVEDNPTDALLVEVALEEMSALAPQMMHVERLQQAENALENDEFDIVLLDLGLPDGQGLGNFERLQRVAPGVPIIVLTGSADGELGIEAIARGAADYLVKGATDAALLERSARYAIERKKNEDDRLEMARLHIARDEAQANSRAKDEFLATLSHELRTPLNAIMGWASLLKTGHLDAETAAQALDTIERNARVQAQLIEDLLDVSRIIAGNFKLEPSDIDLESVVRAAADTLLPSMQAKGITLEMRVEGTSSVRGDAMRLQQVACNLISNAVKFSSDNGQICISLGQQESPDIDLSVPNRTGENRGENGGKQEIFLHVKDAGIGIPAEFLPHVFERFRQADGSTTRRHGGLGLGLAIVRNVVGLHGGRVQAQSEGDGQGATFSIFLPAAPLQRPRVALHACDPDAPSWTGVFILAVDEEADVLDSIRLLFEARGARVETASGASEALEKVERATPHLLILSSDMAVEGANLLEIARAHSLNCPAIALATSSADGAAERALSAGFAKFLIKPLDSRLLCRAAATLLHFEP